MDLLKKILIIDDEEDLCLLLKMFFTRKNYQVSVAYTLKEGMLKINLWHPDIIFLDNNLPDGKGWEKAPNLLEAYPELDIHLISAFYPLIPLESNRLHVMRKPFSSEQLNKLHL